MAITLREVSPDDESFLREVYACTRAQELSMVPWTAEQREAFLRFQFDAQDAHYRSHYPKAAFQLILQDGQPVGRLYVAREESGIRIMDVTVLEQFRAQGVGSSVIRDLMQEADQRGHNLTVWIENFNPSRNLFERMGFSIVDNDGYNDLWEYRPRP